MPNYKGHLVGGVFSFGLLIAIVGYQRPTVQLATWLACTLLGSLFPDIDTTSKIQKISYTMILCVQLFLLYHHNMGAFTLISLMAMVPVIANHRGLFHKLWFISALCIVIASGIAWSLPALLSDTLWALLFFFGGVLSHVILDFGLGRFVR